MKLKKFRRASDLLYDETERRVGHPPTTSDMVRLFPTLRVQYPVLAKLDCVMRGESAADPDDPGGENDRQTDDHMEPRLTQHVRVGNLRKGANTMETLGVKKKKRGKVGKLARQIAKAAGGTWAGLTKEQKASAKKFAREQRAAAKLQKAFGAPAGSIPVPAATTDEAALRTAARDLSDPGRAEAARQALEKLAAGSVGKALSGPRSSVWGSDLGYR